MSQVGTTLLYRTATGNVVEATWDHREPTPFDVHVPAGLRAEQVSVSCRRGRTFSALRLGAIGCTGPLRSLACDQLDAEVLAALRLARWERLGQRPPGVSRLIGYELDGPDPFVLLEPLLGSPIAESAGKLLYGQQLQLRAELLTTLRWTTATGLAHRGLSPRTVRWGREGLQITGFTSCALIGTPRTAVGSPPWAAKEQYVTDRITGMLDERDDVWAAGKLLVYAVSGEKKPTTEVLRMFPDLCELLDGAFGPVEDRPSPRELLERAGLPDPVYREFPQDLDLGPGRREFRRVRQEKRNDAAPRTAERQPSGRGRRWRRRKQ
jgi:serine/threonine protein kinase